MGLWWIRFEGKQKEENPEPIIVRAEFLPQVHRWADQQLTELRAVGVTSYHVQAFQPIDLDSDIAQLLGEDWIDYGGEA